MAELGDDEDLKGDPQPPEIARLLARMIEVNSDDYRLVVTGAALDRPNLHSVLRNAEFFALAGRMYPLRRFIAAPQESENILEVCADLIRHAVSKTDGNLLVFLPGMQEILRLERTVWKQRKPSDPDMNTICLHSDVLGDGEDTQENAENRKK